MVNEIDKTFLQLMFHSRQVKIFINTLQWIYKHRRKQYKQIFMRKMEGLHEYNVMFVKINKSIAAEIRNEEMIIMFE